MTLKRKTTEIIAAATKRRDPVLITRRGQPAAYLVDVETFNDLDKKAAVLEAIGCGERAIQDGRVVSHVRAKRRMSRWLRQ